MIFKSCWWAGFECVLKAQDRWQRMLKSQASLLAYAVRWSVESFFNTNSVVCHCAVVWYVYAHARWPFRVVDDDSSTLVELKAMYCRATMLSWVVWFPGLVENCSVWLSLDRLFSGSKTIFLLMTWFFNCTFMTINSLDAVACILRDSWATDRYDMNLACAQSYKQIDTIDTAVVIKFKVEVVHGKLP